MTEGEAAHAERRSTTEALPGIAMVLGAVALLLGLFLDTSVGGILFIPLSMIGIQLRLKQGGWWRRKTDPS